MNDPKTGPGTTDDPNQATKTGLPERSTEEPSIETRDNGKGTVDPDDPTTGPGTTSDPNQANRT